MPMLTGGQALVQQLKREGIQTIFGLPGIQLDWAFDAIYDERNHFNVYHTRHEQACAYMADGYARATGNIGLAMVVPGPGLLNATGALSTAYAVSSPVFVVTGQIESKNINKGKGLLHEINDQIGMISHITKYQALAMLPGEVPRLVHNAVVALKTGRPRPVEVEIPPDVLEAKAEVSLVEPAGEQHPVPNSELIERAAKLLGQAKSPIIFSGGGVISAGAWAELRRLAELLEAPVVQSNNGRGALSERHYLSFPMRGMQELAPDSDVVLLVGTRFVQGLMAETPQGWMREKTVIQMDVDETEVGRNYTPKVGIVADAKKGLDALANRVESHNKLRESRREELLGLKSYLEEDARRQRPQADYGLAIREAMPEDGVLVNESTQIGYWMARAFPVYQPRTFLTSGYQGTLGFGFATALGAQVGLPGRRVVSVNGDGGFFFNVQELSTMVQHKIPLIAIVFNDNSYGNVKRIQETRFGGRTIASTLHNPNLMKLAEAYGLEGRRANSPEQLKSVLEDVFKSNDPVLIEVPVGPMPELKFAPRARLSA
jgi:acetolactate synthase-1/2/3 large subunit